MIRLFAVLLTACSIASGEPSLEERLASEDPQVRETAQRELDSLGEEELERRAAEAADPEVRSAIQEAARRVRERPIVDAMRALVRRVETEFVDPAAIVGSLDELALPVLLRCLESDDTVTNRYSDFWFCNLELARRYQEIPLAVAARIWLEVFTGESTRDPCAWLAFASARSGWKLSDIVREGLQKRGYCVSDADPENAIAEVLRAIEQEPEEQISPEDYRVRGMRLSAAWLFGEMMSSAIPDPAFPEDARHAAWLAANRGFLAWSDGRIGTRAGRDHYLSLLDCPDAETVRGALRCLLPWAREIAPRVREHYSRFPMEVARILASDRRHTLSKHELRVLIGQAQYQCANADVLALVDGDTLAEIIESESNDELLICELWLLSQVGAPHHAELALEFAVPGNYKPGSRPLFRAWRAAAAVAALGNEEQIRAILPFLRGPEALLNLDVACALARRGRKEGLEPIRNACAAGGMNRLHDRALVVLFEETPESRSSDDWRTWAESIASYRWDPISRRWRK